MACSIFEPFESALALKYGRAFATPGAVRLLQVTQDDHIPETAVEHHGSGLRHGTLNCRAKARVRARATGAYTSTGTPTGAGRGT